MFASAEPQKDVPSWVSDLLAGNDPARVPKNILPDVYQALKEEKSMAISNGSVSLVKQIQNILAAIVELQNPSKNKQIEEEEEDLEPKNEGPDPEIVENALEQLENGTVLTPDQSYLVPYLIPKTKEKKKECLDREDFRKAQVYEDILQYLFRHKFKCSSDNKKVDQYEHIKELYRNAQETLRKEIQKRDEELEEWKKEYQRDQQNFEEQFKQKVEEYDNSIPKELPPSYVKRSQKYLNMRRVEKSLISSKRYTEAAEIKANADELDKIEAQENQKRFDEKVQIGRNKLFVERDRQKECLEEKAERKRVKIVQYHETRIATMQLAVENIERKMREMEENFHKNPLSVPKNRPKPKQNTAEAKNSPFVTQGKDLVSVCTQTLKRYKFPKKN